MSLHVCKNCSLSSVGQIGRSLAADRARSLAISSLWLPFHGVHGVMNSPQVRSLTRNKVQTGKEIYREI